MNYRNTLYDKYFSNQAGRHAENLSTLLGHEMLQLEADVAPFLPENPTARILDIGCGYGNLLFFLQKKGYQQTEGIDLSPEQIEKAQQLGLQNVFCINVFDFLAQPRPPYQCIVALDVIEHLSKEELQQLLATINRVLLPGGSVLFRTPNMDAPLTSVYAYGDFTHETLLNSHSAIQIMQSAGFEQIEVQPSAMIVQGRIKKIAQKVLYAGVSLAVKLLLLATARSAKGVLLSPNMLIKAVKKA